MTRNPGVMLFIDADNVSADVIAQAIAKVKADHGAIHVRRAHCTAEAALKHAKLFKSLSIRPIVNLASGKNSTDIALAVDAMEMVCAERPGLVVIVSSDSDFAPLVIRLREKGCRVCGIGQRGKTGDEVVEVYDEFIDFEHRKPPPAPRAEPPPRARGGRRERPAPAREPERNEGRSAGRGGRGERPAPAPVPSREAERGESRAAGRGARRQPGRGGDRYAEHPLDRPTDLEIERAMGWPPADLYDDLPEPPTEATPFESIAEPEIESVVAEPPAEPPVAPPTEARPVPAKRTTSRRSRGGKPARDASEAAAASAAPDAPASVADRAPAASAPAAARPSAAPEAIAARPPAAPPTTRLSAAPAPAAARPSASPPPAAARPPETAPASPPPVLLPAVPPPPPLSDGARAALAESGLPADVQRVLEAIPELLDGMPFELSHAAERLRSNDLLAKNAPSTKLFKKYPDLFVLTPGRQPNKVRFSGPLPE